MAELRHCESSLPIGESRLEAGQGKAGGPQEEAVQGEEVGTSEEGNDVEGPGVTTPQRVWVLWGLVVRDSGCSCSV